MIGRRKSSTRNSLDESSAAQILDGTPSNGEPAYPRNTKYYIASSRGKRLAFEMAGAADGPAWLIPFLPGTPMSFEN